MKKGIILILTAMSMTQFAESRNNDAQNPAPETNYNLTVSGGVVGMEACDNNNDINNLGTTADVTFGIERHFTPNSNLYWGGKVGIGITANSFEYPSYDNSSAYDYAGNQWNQGYIEYAINKSVDTKAKLTPINIHIGPTFGFCKPISGRTKLDIGVTPEFVYFVGDRDVETKYMYYEYRIYADGTKDGNPDGEKATKTTTHDRLGKFGVSGALSANLIINKFIVGINGKYVHTFDYEPYYGCAHYAVMLTLGYQF
jgi:hypothetical protein